MYTYNTPPSTSSHLSSCACISFNNIGKPRNKEIETIMCESCFFLFFFPHKFTWRHNGVLSGYYSVTIEKKILLRLKKKRKWGKKLWIKMRYVFSLRIVIELTLYIFVEIFVRIYGDNVTLILSMIWVWDGDKRKLLQLGNWNLDSLFLLKRCWSLKYAYYIWLLRKSEVLPMCFNFKKSYLNIFERSTIVFRFLH